MNKLKQVFAKIYRESEAVASDVDSLTVALMGHSHPSMFARVSSHISNNPEHMSNWGNSNAAKENHFDCGRIPGRRQSSLVTKDEPSLCIFSLLQTRRSDNSTLPLMLLSFLTQRTL